MLQHCGNAVCTFWSKARPGWRLRGATAVRQLHVPPVRRKVLPETWPPNAAEAPAASRANMRAAHDGLRSTMPKHAETYMQKAVHQISRIVNADTALLHTGADAASRTHVH